MPRIQVNGASIHYQEQGAGPAVVFAHGVLWSGRMFDAQVAALQGRFRTITFDFRGQGQSEVTDSGYDMDTLAEDAAALIEKLGAAPCHFVGLSMGGFVGMRLAARRPELIRSLVLLETAADTEPARNLPKYKALRFVARWLGLRPVAGEAMKSMFGRKFLEDPARAALRREMRARLLGNDRIGIVRAFGGVLTREGVEDELGKIRVPTLVILGDQDQAIARERAERMHELIAGSRFVIVPGAGHTSTVEEPDAINALLAEFLREPAAASAPQPE